MAFTKLNIAVFAPMPSASVSTATAVKPGFFSSWRMANFRSFMAQRLHRIDSRRAAGGNEASSECDGHEDERGDREDQWIRGGDAKQHALQKACGEHRTNDSQHNAGPC